MSYGIRLRVWGDYACFTRPEMKVERVSYEVMTPSAARGILEAVYWKPAIRWVVDRIHVLKPITFTNIRRNELASTVSGTAVSKAMKDGTSPVAVFVEEDRQQRAAMVLTNVDYVIEAHFEFTSDADTNIGKHLEMFRRRAEKGQCFNTPYLGCREFSANFEWVDSIPDSEISGEKDLGWMLYDIDFAHDMEAHFFKPVMQENGVIEIETPLSYREAVKA